MKTFKDNAGRVWTVSINVDAVRRLRGLLNINLLDAVSDKNIIGNLVDDPVALVNVLFVLCKPEADLRNITDEDFGKAMGGDSIDAATAAFLEDLTDFFPLRQRAMLRKMLEKMGQIQTALAEKGLAMLEKINPSELAENALKKSSGNLPESSESTPDHLRYAS